MAGLAMPETGVVAGGGFARTGLANAKVGGGYVTVRNATGASDRLLGASSPAAGHVEIHMSETSGGVMGMREGTDGFELPAGSELALAPWGTHLMFLKVAKPFAQGDRIPLTLRFEKAGTVETELPVGLPDASSAPDPHAGH